MKVDGYIYIELCLYGSGDYLEVMVEWVIELGFIDYWVIEYVLLLVNFSDVFGGFLDDI